MILAIDASSTKKGGALTHLISLIKYHKKDNSFDKIIIYAPKITLDKIGNSKKLIKRTHFFINFNVIFRLFWQIFFLKGALIKDKANCLFVTCGYYFINFKPSVIIPQNFLPFDDRTIKDYKFSLEIFRIYLLRLFLINSIKKADGIIFLNSFLKKFVKKKINFKSSRTKVIPHGVEKVKIKKNFRNYKEIVYVSDFERYKNHLELFKAFKILSYKYKIKLTCIGDLTKVKILKHEMKISNLDKLNIVFKDRMSRKNLLSFCIKKDIFVFNSTCENFAITLLEGMACKLPIVSSNLEPMKSMIGKGGILVNCLRPLSISRGIETFINSKKLRYKKAELAYKRSLKFSEKIMAKKTINFLYSFKQN